MTLAASTTFTVVFTLFVVAALVLVALTLRFLVRQASASKARWLAEQDDGGRSGQGPAASDGDDGDDRTTGSAPR